MPYSELIKNFQSIRDYMRQFYVYGFKSRSEYDVKSARTYDDVRRRMESWLGEYMSFRQSDSGKIQFLSIDSRAAAHNPLYQVFKAKTFTDNDIPFSYTHLHKTCGILCRQRGCGGLDERSGDRAERIWNHMQCLWSFR